MARSSTKPSDNFGTTLRGTLRGTGIDMTGVEGVDPEGWLNRLWMGWDHRLRITVAAYCLRRG
jgi:hypothetical protein